ncbi:hypothetical protein JW992_12170 [candidate division KSB1 bacterium]|nr:hypothetical protein [candidate division KSB1 bacterium]
MSHNRFTPLLRQFDRELDLPQPIKSRILIEIADDLDDLYTHFRQQGLSEQVAYARTQERLSPTLEILQQLRDIHQSPVQRFFDRIPRSLLSRWERACVLVILLLTVSLSIQQIESTSFFHQASEFIWPVMLAAISGFVLLLIKTYQILLKKEHSPHRIRSGVPMLLLSAGAVPLLSLLGVWVEFHRALLNLARDPHSGYLAVLNALLESSALMVAGLNLFLVLSILTFALLWRIGSIEEANANQLLDPSSE